MSAAEVFVPLLGRSLPVLLDVPAAGALGGLSRPRSYALAESGAMPVLRLGPGRLKVPTVAWLAMLGIDVAPTKRAPAEPPVSRTAS